MSVSSALKDSGIGRFFARGIADAESRIRRFARASPEANRDSDLIPVLEQSALARAISGGRAQLDTAQSSSFLLPVLRHLTAQIKYGPLLLIAAATHVALVSLQQPTGWLWLIVPGVGAAMGSVLAMSERS